MDTSVGMDLYDITCFWWGFFLFLISAVGVGFFLFLISLLSDFGVGFVVFSFLSSLLFVSFSALSWRFCFMFGLSASEYSVEDSPVMLFFCFTLCQKLIIKASIALSFFVPAERQS